MHELLELGTALARRHRLVKRVVESLHVPCVSKVDPTLVGTLVATVLQADDALAGPHLLIAEVSYILVGFLWPDARLAVVASLQMKTLMLATFGTNTRGNYCGRDS